MAQAHTPSKGSINDFDSIDRLTDHAGMGIMKKFSARPSPADRLRGFRGPKGPNPENKSGFRATGHRILLLPDAVEEKSVGGILLVEKTKKAEQDHAVVATVIEVGFEAWMDKSTDYCAVGDRVLIGQYTGKFHESLIDGKLYRFVQDLDVISPVES